MRKAILLLVVIFSSLTLAACGQKGPLYIPEPSQSTFMATTSE